MIDQWRCTVCGYIHEGVAPPDVCPLCHAPAEKFERVGPVQGQKSLIDLVSLELRQIRENFVAHAVLAHFPVALLPTSFLFLVLFLMGNSAVLEVSIFALLLVVGVSAPLTLFSGVRDWKKHYRGEKAAIFIKKITLGWCLVLVLVVLLAWRRYNPAVLVDGGATAALFLLLHLLLVGMVALLGHYGGMLTFGKKKLMGDFF